ncbi:MAG: HAD-IA family hydrolase [Pseudomonadota bacterium]
MGTVVYDLDGTLADTSKDLIIAANKALEILGHAPPLDPIEDARTAFHGGRAMLRLAAQRLAASDHGALVEEGYPIFLDAYDAEIATFSMLYPGAVDSAHRLMAEGYRVAICTNKPEALARKLLDKLQIDTVFPALIGADTLPVRKPDPEPYRAAVALAGGDPARSLLVGDTVTDRETARAAGVPSVLVTFGPAGTSVADLAPEALLDHFDDLPAIAARLLR